MDGRDRPAPPGYEPIRVLGAGGFGEVVLARHVRLDRLVAIKSIHEYLLTDEESLARFQREARVLAATQCPSVVKVYDLCRTGNIAHLVMEYVPGQSLADILGAGPLHGADGLVVLSDVAEALVAAAGRGVVHRDVKPGNVFVLPSGRAKLGDFGLARVASDPSVFRTTGPEMGTPAYFPPELSQGLSEADARSDAYSFAVMAYEVLTGHLPFDGNDAVSLVTAHWTQTPRHPGSIVPGFPEPAAAALLAGMDKAPDRRPLPLDLVERLSAVPAGDWPIVARSGQVQHRAYRRGDPTVRGHPGPKPAPTPVSRPERRPRRKRLIVSSLALAVVLAGAALAGITVTTGGEDLRVEGIVVTAAPVSARAQCPRAVFTFTASISTNGAAGTIDLRWTRPDGELTDPRQAEATSGQRIITAQLEFSVSGSQPLAGDAVIEVLTPNRTSARRAMRYECADAGGPEG